MFAHAKTSAVTNYHKRKSQKMDANKGKRHKIEMTPYNKRIFVEAKKQLKQKNPLKAAQIFESIGMIREAVKVLEHTGSIDAAARVLIKIRAVDRAGYIYARNKQWKKAAMCFEEAGKRQESALCLFEDQSFEAAMSIFVETEDYISAAECAEALNSNRFAAYYSLKSEQEEEACKFYHLLGVETENLSELKLHSMEQDFLNRKVQGGFSGQGVIKLAAQTPKNSKLVLGLCEKHQVEILESVLGYLQESDLDLIIRNLNSDDSSSVFLADTLRKIGSFSFAGRVYELLKDFDSAASCYQSAGLDEKYNFAVEENQSPQSSEKSGNALFVLDVTGQNDSADDMDVILAKAESKQQPEHNKSLLEYTSPRAARVKPNLENTAEESEEFDLQVQNDVAMPDDQSFESDSSAFVLSENKSLEPSSDAEYGLEGFSLQDASGDLEGLLTGSPENLEDPLEASLTQEDDRSQSAKQDSNIQSMDEYISEPFKESQMMVGFSDEEIKKIWSMGEVMNVEAGSKLVDYYVRIDGLYTVLSGQLIRYVRENDEDVFVNHVGKSGSFGEFWLVGDLPNSNMWKADVQSKVHVFTVEQFSKLAKEHPSLATKMYKRINEKIFRMMSENPTLKTSLAG